MQMLQSDWLRCRARTIDVLQCFGGKFRNAIGDLHDGVIRLQLPESLTLSVCHANWGHCSLNPLGLQNFNNKKIKGILVVLVK